MGTVRVCLLLVVLINVCTDHVSGKPIFWTLLADYLDYDSNSTSVEDDDCDWIFWTCDPPNRRRTTTVRPATVLPTQTSGSPSFQVLSQQPLNMTMSSAPDGSIMVTINKLDGAPAASSPAVSPPAGSPPAGSPPASSPSPPTSPASSTAAPPATTAAGATPAATTAATTAAAGK